MTVSSVIRDKARALLLIMSGYATFEEASLRFGLDATGFELSCPARQLTTVSGALARPSHGSRLAAEPNLEALVLN